jgi:hypothetical protein
MFSSIPGSPPGESLWGAAGLEPNEPAKQEVTAACDATIANERMRVDGANVWLDFALTKKQFPIARLLDHLGLTPRQKGGGPQRRCACPIHRGDGQGRTFIVNLR